MAGIEKIIGIDQGTTFPVVAVMEGSEPEVIVNKEGNRQYTPPEISSHANSKHLYEQAGRASSTTGSDASSTGDDDTVDAEFEVKS